MATVILYQAFDSAIVAWIAMGIYVKAHIVGERVGRPELKASNEV